MARRWLVPVLGCALACCSISKANTVTNLNVGQSVDLGTWAIQDGNAIQIGDKLFDNFSYMYTDSTGMTNYSLPSGAVTLAALSNMVGFGLSLEAPLNTASNLDKDFIIKYSVTVTDPSMKISDMHMTFNGVALNNGFCLVDEAAYDSAGFGVNSLGAIQVDNIPPSPANLQAMLTFEQPQTEIYIEKDIELGGSGGSDFASISIIDQTFSQIPEPSSVMLTVVGLAGLWLMRRRRR